LSSHFFVWWMSIRSEERLKKGFGSKARATGQPRLFGVLLPAYEDILKWTLLSPQYMQEHILWPMLIINKSSRRISRHVKFGYLRNSQQSIHFSHCSSTRDQCSHPKVGLDGSLSLAPLVVHSSGAVAWLRVPIWAPMESKRMVYVYCPSPLSSISKRLILNILSNPLPFGVTAYQRSRSWTNSFPEIVRSSPMRLSDQAGTSSRLLANAERNSTRISSNLPLIQLGMIVNLMSRSPVRQVGSLTTGCVLVAVYFASTFY
jgi:hypothetical protein